MEKYGNYLNDNSPKHSQEKIDRKSENKFAKHNGRDKDSSSNRYKTMNQQSDDEKSPDEAFRTVPANRDRNMNTINTHNIRPVLKNSSLSNNETAKHSEKLQKYEMHEANLDSSKKKVKENLDYDTENKMKGFIEENEYLREENANLIRLLERERVILECINFFNSF